MWTSESHLLLESPKRASLVVREEGLWKDPALDQTSPQVPACKCSEQIMRGMKLHLSPFLPQKNSTGSKNYFRRR